MHVRLLRPLSYASLLASALALVGCAEEAPYDWRNRELAWKYGPTSGTASQTHMLGTGTKGKGAIAQSWHLHLKDAHTLSLKPYQLASQHELFGRAKVAVQLFDKQSQSIETYVTEPVTAETEVFDFEIDEAVAKRAYDAILWYRAHE